MNSNKKKSSDFFKEISGCPLAMRNGWMRQAVQAEFRGGEQANFVGDYDQPIVLVFYGGGETNLCNLHHRALARHIAAHLWQARGWVAAIEAVAAVTDAISMGHSYAEDPRLSAMGYSLFSRELFASSIVQQVEINRADAAIIITGCDKTVAGGMLAASWLNELPVVLLHGASATRVASPRTPIASGPKCPTPTGRSAGSGFSTAIPPGTTRRRGATMVSNWTAK